MDWPPTCGSRRAGSLAGPASRWRRSRRSASASARRRWCSPSSTPCCLRPLPLGEHSERIVTLHSTHKSQAEDWEDSNLSYADLQDLRAQTRGLEDVAGYVGRTANTLTFGGESERLRGGSVTPNLFPLLGLRPALGRTFQDEDAADFGFEPEVVLSYRLFERRFGADRRVVGQTVILNGRALTIIGVMPPGIRFPERDDFWVAYRPSSDPERAPTRARRFVAGFGLLRAGVTLPQVQSEVDVVAAALAEQHPGHEPRLGRASAVVPRLGGGPGHASRRVRAARRRGRGAADRLRQPRQPDARARRRAPARARGARLARREPRPPRAPDARRDGALVRGRRPRSASCSEAGSSSCRSRPGPRSCRTG